MREADVLALLLVGATDRAAAAALGVAPATIRTHARALLRKVGAADRHELRRLDVRSPGIAAPLGDLMAAPLGDLCAAPFDRSSANADPALPAFAAP